MEISFVNTLAILSNVSAKLRSITTSKHFGRVFKAVFILNAKTIRQIFNNFNKFVSITNNVNNNNVKFILFIFNVFLAIIVALHLVL